MKDNIKMVAVDVDGTFVHKDYYYDVPRFKRIFSRMKELGCEMVVASGNQYYQLRDLFPEYHEELSFVAENGAFVKAKSELLFTADVPKETVDFVVDMCNAYPEMRNVMCGVNSAYCEQGSADSTFFEAMKTYYHRLAWVQDFKKVEDRILKFASNVPYDKMQYYEDVLKRELDGKMLPINSGNGAIDLIMPGCHKASGLKRLAERWGITPEQCVAFGDGGNDIEMLKYCGYSYAMANASQNVKAAAKFTCPSNEEDGVLQTLEELLF